MPIYDFKCTECGAIKETIAKSSTEFIECKSCGAKMSRTVASGSQSFYFKGQGAYCEKSMSKKR